MMIFLSVLALVTYALFGAPLVAPVQPVHPSEKAQLSPRTRKREVEKNKSKKSKFSWWSDTAVGPKSTPDKSKPRKRGPMVPRTNRGYELRLSACLKREKSHLNSCSLSRSLSYTLNGPTVPGLPTVRPRSPVQSNKSRNNTGEQNGADLEVKTKKIPSVITKKSQMNDAKVTRKQFIPNVAVITRSTLSGLRHQLERITGPLSNVISKRKPSKKDIPTQNCRRSRKYCVDKTMSSITRVTKDPRTKKVTVFEAKTHTLFKSRPSAAPIPPVRWRF